jgi:hypothetical protein
VPYFNAPIFLQNKTQVGKIEEIFGSITTPVRRAPPPAPAPSLRPAAAAGQSPHRTLAGHTGRTPLRL